MKEDFGFKRSLLCVIAAGALTTSPLAEAQKRFPSRPDRLPPGILAEEDQSRAVLPADIPLRRVNEAGMKLTQVSEGWSAKLYDDAAGYCTIGYGHLIKKARCNGSELPEFLRGITKPRGAEILAKDMSLAEITVMLEVVPQLADNQYAAMVDFVFNVGGKNFRTSTLLKRLNEGKFDDVPAQLGRWTKANGKVFPGLVTRRKAEADLFVGRTGSRRLPSPDEDMTPIDIATGEKSKP